MLTPDSRCLRVSKGMLSTIWRAHKPVKRSASFTLYQGLPMPRNKRIPIIDHLSAWSKNVDAGCCDTWIWCLWLGGHGGCKSFTGQVNHANYQGQRQVIHMCRRQESVWTRLYMHVSPRATGSPLFASLRWQSCKAVWDWCCIKEVLPVQAVI